MRKTKSILFCLSVVCLFLSCRKTASIVSQETAQEIMIANHSSTIYGVLGSDTLYVDSATIVIDHSRVFHSDSKGRCYLDSLLAGSHEISITHDSFYQLDTTINLADSTELSFRMTPRVEDYLPLKPGNHWNYSYAFRSGYTVTSQSLLINGTFSWDVLSVVKLDSAKQYEIGEIFDYMRVENVGIPTLQIDTIYGHSSGSFLFVEDNKHRIIIEPGSGTVTVCNLPNDFTNTSFIRYSVPTRDDGRSYISMGSEYYPYVSWAKSKTGIESYSFYPYQGNHYQYYTVTLSSYSLVH